MGARASWVVCASPLEGVKQGNEMTSVAKQALFPARMDKSMDYRRASPEAGRSLPGLGSCLGRCVLAEYGESGAVRVCVRL